jgi:hypothetical protein
MMNHRVLVNLRAVDLNLVLMVLMKVYSNQGAQDDRKSQLNLVVMNRDATQDVHLMDDQNSLVDLNYRVALP